MIVYYLIVGIKSHLLWLLRKETTTFSVLQCLYSNLRHEVCWNHQGNKLLIAPLPNFDV